MGVVDFLGSVTALIPPFAGLPIPVGRQKAGDTRDSAVRPPGCGRAPDASGQVVSGEIRVQRADRGPLTMSLPCLTLLMPGVQRFIAARRGERD